MIASWHRLVITSVKTRQPLKSRAALVRSSLQKEKPFASRQHQECLLQRLHLHRLQIVRREHLLLHSDQPNVSVHHLVAMWIPPTQPNHRYAKRDISKTPLVNQVASPRKLVISWPRTVQSHKRSARVKQRQPRLVRPNA